VPGVAENVKFSISDAPLAPSENSRLESPASAGTRPALHPLPFLIAR